MGNPHRLREITPVFGKNHPDFEKPLKRGETLYSTVHTYLTVKKAETGTTLGKIEQYIEEHYPELSMSDTKLSKIFKDPKAKISIEELFAIVEAMKLDRREILSILGEQEYRASEAVGYKGASELIADFQRRESNLHATYKEQLEKEAVIRRNIHKAFTDSTDRFDRATGLFEAHLSDLQDDNKELVKRVAKLETSRKAMFWGLLTALLSVIALFVVFIVIDAPQIGAGW